MLLTRMRLKFSVFVTGGPHRWNLFSCARQSSVRPCGGGANAPKLKDEANLGHVRMQSHRMNENIGGPPARAGHSLFGCPYSDITSQEKRIHEHTHSLLFSSDISTQTCITVP